MADKVTNYQCPACTGPLHFDSTTGKLVCDYCGSAYEVADIEAQYAQKQQKAAAAAASWPPHPAAQGIVQMIGVFIDTIVICTASAIIVMLAPRPDNEYTLNGIQDLQHAMSVLVGGWGADFIALIVLLFAFSSIVANYVYAENNLIFLHLDKPRYIWGLRILTVLMVLLGTLVSLPVVWQSADIIMALMAMTNLTAILLLSPTVRIIASDYLRQRRLGIQPTFDATRYPDIDQQLAPGAWNELPRE